jgi:hypothetical protein
MMVKVVLLWPPRPGPVRHWRAGPIESAQTNQQILSQRLAVFVRAWTSGALSAASQQRGWQSDSVSLPSTNATVPAAIVWLVL